MYASLGNKSTNKAFSLVIHLIFCKITVFTLIYGAQNFYYFIPSNSWNKWVFEMNNHFNWLNWQILISFIFSHYNVSCLCFFTEYKHVKNRCNERKGSVRPCAVGWWHSKLYYLQQACHSNSIWTKYVCYSETKNLFF